MTEMYHATDPMLDVIGDDYRMLQLMSRFGIKLGFGEQSVQTACENAGVDVPTFLTVVNYLKHSNPMHVAEMSEHICVSALLKYLKNSHSYFMDFRLPAIRRKLLEAVDCAAEHRIAFLVLRFYDEFVAEVGRHMNYENTQVHPYVEVLLSGKLPTENFDAVVDRHANNHTNIEKSLTELKKIIIKYYPPNSNANLLNDVLMDIYMTEEDLLVHCRLEDTLFAQSVRRLEEELREAGAGSETETPEQVREENRLLEALSEREKEVVLHVVKGLSNKEIADRMFISVNTVMTHRRNISRKLEIHSVAGLTIYAIVNGLVNLQDLKF